MEGDGPLRVIDPGPDPTGSGRTARTIQIQIILIHVPEVSSKF